METSCEQNNCKSDVGQQRLVAQSLALLERKHRVCVLSASRDLSDTFSIRGNRRSLMVRVGENAVRVYRLTKAYGTKRYYRCSTCETINKTAPEKKRPKLITTCGSITSSHDPEHHTACQPLTLQQLRAREVDLICRREVRKGICEPREAWVQGHKIALSDDKQFGTATRFPAWETARKSYAANRRRHLATISNPFDLLPCYCNTLRGNLTNTVERWLLVQNSGHGILAFSSDAELRAAAASDILIVFTGSSQSTAGYV
uniref:FLYWCH-type domain-containing protein n=1 Tax=Ascaris lumbricoides TaxID=6252 RepID=A0A0M3HT68_ASCLU